LLDKKFLLDSSMDYWYNSKWCQALAAHACNPSYLGGWDWEDRDSRTNSLWDPNLQNNQSKVEWRQGSSSRVPVLQVQTPVHQKKIVIDNNAILIQFFKPFMLTIPTLGSEGSIQPLSTYDQIPYSWWREVLGCSEFHVESRPSLKGLSQNGARLLLLWPTQWIQLGPLQGSQGFLHNPWILE
jgi:hypothetical protein